MSDNSISIVDIDATSDEAPALAERILANLIAQGIVLGNKTDCTLGEPGHPPGPSFETALTAPYPSLTSLATNGVEIVTARTVFDTGGNGTELRCAACQVHFDPGETYFDQVGAWYEGDDAVQYSCPSCGHTTPLTDWDGPFAFGLGHLGFTFWNWPPLKPEFVQSINAALGHRVRIVQCHV